MDFLIVEDDPFKYGELLTLLTENWPTARIQSANSVHGAVAAIAEAKFDVIILDIALPSHDLRRGEGSPTSMPSGGIEALLELDYLQRGDHVVIVTQYPEIEIEGKLVPLPRAGKVLRSMMSVNLAGVILFDKYATSWKSEMRAIMGNLK